MAFDHLFDYARDEDPFDLPDPVESPEDLIEKEMLAAASGDGKVETLDLGKNFSEKILPHDCLIREITVEGETLVLRFEEDVTYHDGATEQMPAGAKSLVMRYHLFDPEIEIFRYRRLFGRDFYTKTDLSWLQKQLSVGYDVSFLNQHLAYRSVIMDLWALTPVRIDLSADRIEYEWL